MERGSIPLDNERLVSKYNKGDMAHTALGGHAICGGVPAACTYTKLKH